MSLEDERLELQPGVVYFLGPGLTLRNCTLVLKVSSRNLIIPEARFTHCTFDVKKELKNFNWEHALLEGCRFTGRLMGNDFGRWPDSRPGGGIKDCDFSGAQLDACRFLDCDVNSLHLPRWPCFTILDPVRRSGELSAVQWPSDIGLIARGFAKAPPSTVAVTYLAPALAKRRDTTPEAIRATLEKLDGVLY